MPTELVQHETNPTAITTTGSGTFQFNATKLRRVTFAAIDAAGWHTHFVSASAQAIVAQVYGQSAASGVLTTPTASQTLATGAVNVLEFGF